MNRNRSASAWFDRVLYALMAVASFFILFVSLAVSCDVVARYVFNSPMAWVFNVSQHLLLYIVFFAAAWVLKDDGHVKIDMIEAKIKGWRGDFLRLVTSLLSMAACAVLFWTGINAVLRSFKWGTILPGPPPVHEYILLAVIPLGSLLLAVQFGRDCWHHINKLRGSL